MLNRQRNGEGSTGRPPPLRPVKTPAVVCQSNVAALGYSYQFPVQRFRASLPAGLRYRSMLTSLLEWSCPGVDAQRWQQIALAAGGAFSHIVRHGGLSEAQNIAVRIEHNADQVELQLSHAGRPTLLAPLLLLESIPALDLTVDQIGQLLVRRCVDEVHHEHGVLSTLRLVKRL